MAFVHERFAVRLHKRRSFLVSDLSGWLIFRYAAKHSGPGTCIAKAKAVDKSQYRQHHSANKQISCARMSKGITKRGRTSAIIRPGPEGELLLPDGAGSVCYVRNFLSEAEANELMEQTKNANSWARTPISFFGKSVLQPRDTAFFGTKLYSYSDERRIPTAWDEDPPASTALKKLSLRIEEHLKLPKDWFNVILANRYHHGRDFMGWHSDNEKSLGDEPVIASISLGAERRFLIKRKCGKEEENPTEKIEYILEHGSLLVMKGKMQKLYQHSLPKVALSKCDKLRLNFTYRRVIDESDHSKA